LILAHAVSSTQQHSPTQEAFRPTRPSQPSPSFGPAGSSCHPGRAPPHAAVPASPLPSFLLHGRCADQPASPTELPLLPTTPPFSFNAETAGIDATTTGHRPTPPLPPRPYKRGAHHHRSSPPSPPLSIPPLHAWNTALTEPLWPPPAPSITRPSHRLPLPGEFPGTFVTSSFHFLAAAGEHR
jgi:hypothetical protein